MVFKVGETVVYPHHGAALIEAIETRLIKGEEKKYLVLKVAQGDLTVRVPADNAEIVGVRDVVGQDGLNRVFEVLRAPHTEEPTNWSRRYKANLEKLASGDVNKVAEVVRDLWRREKDRGLSAGEKRMLAKARQILSVSSHWLKELTKTRPRSCWTRSSLPHPEFVEHSGGRGRARSCARARGRPGSTSRCPDTEGVGPRVRGSSSGSRRARPAGLRRCRPGCRRGPTGHGGRGRGRAQ